MTKPKQILNDPANAVAEYIAGLLAQYPHHYRTLKNHAVLLSADPQPNQSIFLLSGGGSGHEPSHGGWVGNGMLAAAVCGGIFASPSVAAIKAGLQGVVKLQKDCCQGILMIVKNYTGDRLNFGVAAEQFMAAQRAVKVEMVVVDDDVALPWEQPARGVAGTVLVHKMAGAAAASGKTLAQVAQTARQVNACMGTLGIALNSVTVLGAEQVNDRLAAEGVMEIGLGIHGEAGRRQSALPPAKEMAREMVSSIQEYGRVASLEEPTKRVPLVGKGNELCILVNNLGGASNFELSLLTNSILDILESTEYGGVVTHVLVGTYMTSLNMKGVSLTILNLSVGPTAEWNEFLKQPTTAPAWSPIHVWNRDSSGSQRPSLAPLVLPVEEPSTKSAILPSCSISDFSTRAHTLLQAVAEAIIAAEPELTKLDTIVGDGDCGITWKRGATAILEALQENAAQWTAHPVTMATTLAEVVSHSMGGTSGILLELAFSTMGRSFLEQGSSGLDATALVKATRAGAHAIATYGGAKQGDRTMLDALLPATEVLPDLAKAAAAARAGAEGTASMKEAAAGRSAYINESNLHGTPDPGAVAVAVVLEAMSKSS